jgi:mono/diheme cytochrome c family protein
MNEIDRRGHCRIKREVCVRFRGAVQGRWVTCGVVAAFCLIPAAGFAQTQPKSVASTDVQRGRDTFQQHCAVCHGERGKGDGPAAGALRERPVDLATLTKQKGTFPAAFIRGVLKSTDPVVAHGSSGMMIWGALFLAEANGNQAQADANINDVIKFIESIQAK